MTKELGTLFILRYSILLGLLTLGAILDAKNGDVDRTKTAELAGKGALIIVLSCGGTTIKRRALTKKINQLKKE